VTLRQVFIRVQTGDTVNHVGISTQLCEPIATLTFSLSLVHLPPLPLRFVKEQYLETMCGWEGVGVLLSPVGDHILQKFNTLYLTRFRNSKLPDHPKRKPRRVEGLGQIITCRKVPLQINIFL
jgi:hypothetical protein